MSTHRNLKFVDEEAVINAWREVNENPPKFEGYLIFKDGRKIHMNDQGEEIG